MQNGSENRRRNRNTNGTEAPRRVTEAARMMQQSPSSAGYRGYVPQQSSVTQEQAQNLPQTMYTQFSDGQPDTRYRNTGNTQTAQNTGAFRGFTPAAATPEPPQKKPRKKHGLRIFIVLLIAAALAGGAFIVRNILDQRAVEEEITKYSALFCPNVYVDGIQLGGMTWEQALNSVQSQIQRRNDAWKVNLVRNGNTVATITADMLNMEVDVEGVLHQAWAQGHAGTTVDERYEEMLKLAAEPYYGFTTVPDKDTSVIDEVLNQIREQIDVKASNAELLSFDTTQAYPFIFSDEIYGQKLDVDSLKEQLYHMVAVMQSGDVELHVETIAPTVTKTDLQKHYMLRSSEYTRISTSSTDDRNKNIQRACEKINGTVIQPGKQFSFNKVVGERTTANGFFPAVEYVYGEHTEGIGGGVCQVSSTVYQAAVCAGMKIVKRTPHSDAVNYTGYGSDATVYWVGKRIIDFVFQNNTDEPIYLVAAVQQDPDNKKRLITRISIYGADMGDVWYRLETQQTAELEPPDEPKYIKDTEGTYVTYTDQQKSVFKPESGYVFESYRVKYSGTEEIGRELLATDTYDPKPERIYVGVKTRE